MKQVARNLLITGMALLLATCATTGGGDGLVPLERRSVDLVLENRSWDHGTFRVFARSGQQIARYSVPALSSDTVTIRAPYDDELVVTLRPLASRERWRLQPVMVQGGDVVFVTMQNHLPLSTIAIYPVGEDYWEARYDHPEPVVFNGLERVDPPREWYAWWEDAEECVGEEADMEDVTWFVSPSMYIYSGPSKAATFGVILSLNGLHWKGQIYVREMMADSARLIKHEAAHNILNVNGVSDTVNARHEHPAFEECEFLKDREG